MQLRNLSIPAGAVFAPMAGLTDAACRHLMADHGAAWTVSEMASAKALNFGDRKSLELLRDKHPHGLYAVQLFGAEPESMDVTDLIAHVREAGKGAAISRRALASMMDVSDRHLRRIIEEARNCGYLIIDDSDGTGYFLAASSADIERHFRQENARALSILKRLKAARTRLKEVNII